MISYENEELFLQDSVKKQLTITDGATINLTNSDLYSESFSLKEGLCSEECLVFGSCEAGEIKFTTSNVNLSFMNKWLTVKIKLANETSLFTVGRYLVVEDKLSADRSRREVRAVDAMYSILNADVTEWYERVFPSASTTITLKNFRDSFFNELGITQKSATLICDNLTLSKTISSQQIMGSDVIRAICEVNGVFGHITRDNQFSYVSLSNTSAYTVETSMYRSMEYADYSCQQITGLQIRSEENDIGVQVGTDENPYIIENNFLFYGMGSSILTEIANTIFNKIGSLTTYVPLKVECIGNPCVEVGDRITVEKTDDTTVDTWIMHRELSGIQRLFETYESTGEQYRPQQMSGITYQITKLKGKSNVLERTIEGTTSRVTDLESGLTEVTQTATELNIKVESLQSQIDGEQQYYEAAGVPTLTNYPAYDFTYNIPCNDTVKVADDLGFEYKDEWYQKHLLNLYFDTDGAMSYRFQKNEQGGFYWREVADGQISQISQRLHTVEITADGLTSEVRTITTELDEVAGDLENNYFTKTDTTSRINQSSTNILQTVSRTYTTQDTTSSMQTQINQQADMISAKAEKNGESGDHSFAWNLDATGFYLASDGVSVMEVNGNGLIVKGNIQANSGKIGKWSIDENGMFFRRNDGGNTHFQNDGNIVAYDSNGNVGWFINANGAAQFNNVTVNGYATNGTVSALRGEFDTLKTKAITSDNIHSQQIYASQINVDSLMATTSMSSTSINAANIYIGNGGLHVNYHEYRDQAITIGGRTYHLLVGDFG